MGDFYTALDWIGALLLCAALAMVALTHREMRAARALILFGSMVVVVRWVSWSFTTDVSWQIRSILGAAFGALLLGGAPLLWQWSIHKEKTAQIENQPKGIDKNDIPPIGSLRMEEPTLTVEFSKGRKQISASIHVKIFNDTNKLIRFAASTAGRINDVWFDVNRVHFDGFIPAHGNVLLMSKRLPNIPAPLSDVPNQYITGIYEYELRYAYAESKSLDRKSARGVRIILWHEPPPQPVGTSVTIPQTVETYLQSEE